VLHYLGGRIHLEICLPRTAVADVDEARALTARLQQACKQLHEVGEVVVYFRETPSTG
jgi:hypothetical protein